MTIPTGHPDWQNIDAKAGAPLLYNAAFSAPVLTLTAAMAVGNYNEIWLRADPSGTSSYKVSLIWLDTDPGGIVLWTEDFFILAPNEKISLCRPCISPWVQIEVIPVSFSVGDTIRLSLSPVTARSTLADLNGPMVAEVVQQNVPAGNTQTFDCNYVAPGWTQWFFGLDGSTGEVSITAMDLTGVFHTEYIFKGLTGPFFDTRTIVLPPRPCRAVVHNTGGAAANFWSVLGTGV